MPVILQISKLGQDLQVCLPSDKASAGSKNADIPASTTCHTRATRHAPSGIQTRRRGLQALSKLFKSKHTSLVLYNFVSHNKLQVNFERADCLFYRPSESSIFQRTESLHPPGHTVTSALLTQTIKQTHCIIHLRSAFKQHEPSPRYAKNLCIVDNIRKPYTFHKPSFLIFIYLPIYVSNDATSYASFSTKYANANNNHHTYITKLKQDSNIKVLLKKINLHLLPISFILRPPCTFK